jgi:tetratricopeptide (TPR) repeat protein
VNIKCSAHAHAMRYDIGMLQRKVHGLVRPETAPGHCQLRTLILPPDEWHKLMQDVTLILQMSQHPHLGMDALVVPALSVNRVRAKYLQFPALNFWREHTDHSAVFILEELSHGGGEHQQRSARMPENQRLHLAVKFLAVGFVVFAIHRGCRASRPISRGRSILPEREILQDGLVSHPGPRPVIEEDDIVIRDMSWRLPKLVPRSAPVILLVLTLAAATGFAAVGHLVARYNANQQSRGRKLYALGVAAAGAGRYDEAIAAFRAALTCDRTNSQYQLSLARALRDSNDPRRLDEAESYLVALWQRTPQDAAVNLALARVAAHRGSIEDATRYYHNAMYGVWNSDPDSNRSRARIELIQFLLKKGAPANAEAELMALSTSLPPEPAAHLQAAQLFAQAQDYSGALTQYREVLHLDPLNSSALIGAGEAAYNAGNYAVAQHYLQEALNRNPQDANARQLLGTTELIVRTNPFRSHISDVERNRRITAAFGQAGRRLTDCAQQTGVDLNATGASPASPLASLQARWTSTKPELNRLRSPAETDLPDAIMDVVFQIEQQTASVCGRPQGPDLALFLISQKREAAIQ